VKTPCDGSSLIANTLTTLLEDWLAAGCTATHVAGRHLNDKTPTYPR
jgi:hypothetical protein